MKRTYIPFLVAAALFEAGCESEIQTPDEYLGIDGFLCFQPVFCGNGTVDGANGHAEPNSASRTKATELVSADDSVSVPLWCSISDGVADAASNDTSPQTKGKQLNNLDNDDYPISNFYVKAYKGSSAFISSYEQVSKGSDSYWRTSASHLWGAAENATFYAYANLPSVTGTATVESSSSASQTLNYDATKVQSASTQTDILMGFYSGKSRYDATKHMGGIADIKFYHPLTAVRFKLGEFSDNPTVVIKKISISGVYAVGTATMTPPTGSATVPGISWTPNTTAGTTTVTLGDGTSAISVGTTDKLIGEPFLLIPQNLTSQSVKITVDLTLNGTPKTLEAMINTGEWVAGKTNTYTLGYRNYKLMVSGEVSTDYTGAGDTEYSVTSSTNWKLQYTTDGSTWTDAEAGTTIGGWIKFNKVSGSGSTSAQTVTATVTAATGTTTINLDDHAATLRAATPKGSADAPYDLSMHTIYGDERTGGPVTANCYVIDAPGWYAFPLVYGNAIDWAKNTSTGINTKAYSPTGSGTNFLTIFQSSEGNITTPYITGATSACPYWEDVPSYGLIAADGCSILNKNDAAAKGLTACDCGYVVFQVNKSTLTQGNAVIAVSNDSNILWSWHIWVTDLDLTTRIIVNTKAPDKDKHGNTVPNTGRTTATFSKGVMPHNLGWVDLGTATGYPGKSLQIRFVQIVNNVVENEVIKNPKRKDYMTESPNGQSPTWQWGRKDPFIRFKDDGSELTTSEYSGTGMTVSSASNTLSTAIKSPAEFFSSLTGYGWHSGGGRYVNLWSATLTNTTATGEGYDDTPVKTVYDPCPPGFQVPQMDAFDRWSYDGKDINGTAGVWSGSNTGYKLTAQDSGGEYIFFPATGIRNGGSQTAAAIWYKNNNIVISRYWTAAPDEGTGNRYYAYQFVVGELALAVNHQEYKTFGNSIRPVVE